MDVSFYKHTIRPLLVGEYKWRPDSEKLVLFFDIYVQFLKEYSKLYDIFPEDVDNYTLSYQGELAGLDLSKEYFEKLSRIVLEMESEGADIAKLELYQLHSTILRQTENLNNITISPKEKLLRLYISDYMIDEAFFRYFVYTDRQEWTNLLNFSENYLEFRDEDNSYGEYDYIDDYDDYPDEYDYSY